MWLGARSRAPRRPGQLLRVVERPSVGVPPVGCPDLGVVARSDDHGFAAEADRFAQVGRQQDPALAIHLGLDRVPRDEALEEARLSGR